MKTDSLLSPALQRIRELHEEDYSQRDIVKFLQAEGVPLPPGRRQKWNLHGVQAALQQLAALPSPPSPPPAPPIAAVPPPAEGDQPPVASLSEPPPDPATPRRLKIKIQGPWIDTDSLLWEFLIHKVWETPSEARARSHGRVQRGTDDERGGEISGQKIRTRNLVSIPPPARSIGARRPTRRGKVRAL